MAEESGVVSRQKNTVASTRIGGYECISLRGVTHDTRSHQAERGLAELGLGISVPQRRRRHCEMSAVEPSAQMGSERLRSRGAAAVASARRRQGKYGESSIDPQHWGAEQNPWPSGLCYQI